MSNLHAAIEAVQSEGDHRALALYAGCCRKVVPILQEPASITLGVACSARNPAAGSTTIIGTKDRRFDPLPRDVSLEDLVPEDHFYRRLVHGADVLGTVDTRGLLPDPRYQTCRSG